MAIPFWVRKYAICYSYEIIFFIGKVFTFSLNILFLFENGKPVAARSEWDLHSQKEYLFWECKLFSKVEK